ncbi:hypothetical protein [Streptomyces sp. enrichment culture]|uniref:hypothetical protein n=1 Tax=Streptomyces sp. enrichment culture TaxID=1795815 RepID=UPI003F55A7BF
MPAVSRRALLGTGVGAALALGTSACGALGEIGDQGPAGRPGTAGGTGSGTAGGTGPGTGGGGDGKGGGRRVRPLGDGSTADTGPQPRQPARPAPLEPGQTPPQFVVFSWDGAGEVGNGLFPRFLDLAREHGAAMTFFLSGIYLLPESRKSLYRPPRNNPGASDIGYLTDAHIKDTLENLRRAWLDGHEIGTHFNGHFCGGSGSVAHWTPDDWRAEIDQAVKFVTEWKTNSGWIGLDPLPFDYRGQLIGGRTPCLLGRDNLLPTARKLGWRYDASSPGGLQVWPARRQGLWDLPLQAVPFPGYSFEVLSMDYNILANQSGNTTRGVPSRYPGWKKQATEAYLAGFTRAYETNRAPLFIGNHFEQWNGGIYMDAVEDALKEMAGKKDVRLVSFRQLVDWLDAQDPGILRKLRSLSVGESPAGGWNSFLRA